MKHICGGLIQDVKSLVDTITNGLSKLFDVVTGDGESEDGISFSKKLSDGRDVTGKITPDPKEGGLVSIRVSVTGSPAKQRNKIKEDLAINTLMDMLKTEYGIDSSEISASQHISPFMVFGLKKVLCHDGFDVMLTNVYTDATPGSAKSALDTLLDSDELIDSLGETPTCIAVVDDGNDYAIDTELADAEYMVAVEMQNRVDRVKRAAVLRYAALTLEMELYMTYHDRSTVVNHTSIIRDSAQRIFIETASKCDDLSFDFCDLPFDSICDPLSVIRESIEYLDMFSVNMDSETAYQIRVSCDAIRSSISAIVALTEQVNSCGE